MAGRRRDWPFNPLFGVSILILIGLTIALQIPSMTAIISPIFASKTTLKLIEVLLIVTIFAYLAASAQYIYGLDRIAKQGQRSQTDCSPAQEERTCRRILHSKGKPAPSKTYVDFAFPLIWLLVGLMIICSIWQFPPDRIAWKEYLDPRYGVTHETFIRSTASLIMRTISAVPKSIFSLNTILESRMLILILALLTIPLHIKVNTQIPKQYSTAVSQYNTDNLDTIVAYIDKALPSTPQN